MIINLLIARFFKRDLASQTEPLDQDIEHDEQAEAQQKSKLLTILATHLHLTTMLPLAIITILADINLGLAAVICVAEIIFFMIIGYLLYRKRYIKIYPKKYDIFNVQLYICITIVAYAAPIWLHRWLSVYVNLSNAAFMWSTILLPCFDPFCMDNIRDRIPDRIARHPLAQAMALGISVTWAVALTVMGVAAVILAAAKFPPEQMKLAVILCGYVFGIGPLIIAIIVQNIISHVYKKRLLKLKEEAAAQQQQQEQQLQKAVQPVATTEKAGRTPSAVTADTATGPDAV